ncbi:GEVED domain-containing protein [Marixanthomonas ophiurae]|uniref:T9SS C-terminal target domain-containing protein n=1 Tax=Marixanthomonas ophiurae TaxID=387659 RepID=A0A3E1Q6T6_9FLAO|nr:GEVED domain-containing protein [Marixanthomonas ophiurae]RFN57847.1 T9SS C-terminal target domain-containing protein [Marixanthomonas ophiurae]
MKIKNLLLLFTFFCTYATFAQDVHEPDVIATGKFVKKTIPLRDMPVRTTIEKEETSNLKIIQNRLRANRKTNENALPLDGDGLAQKKFGGVTTKAIEQNFDGADASEGQATPPDPTGAVGPNHYVHAVNLVVKIFDKSGSLLAGPTFLGDFLGSGNNSGDPIVLYDQLADRFFVSQFDTGNDSLIIGVSETSDPTGSYNVYEFPLDAFPDYPHYSVWPDAYYLTANKFSGNTTYALERDALLAGDPEPKIIGFNLPGVTNNPDTVFSPEPANLTGTSFPADVPGYIVYLQDDGWSGVTFDHLKVWEIELDWSTTSNSTISSPLEIPTTPFEATFAPFGTGDVGQPGTNQKIDMIGGVISYAANYRSFGSHNSWVITFNVDVDGNDTSGIRWIELRNDASNDWSIFQEGTYAPADGNSRFMGSAAMDAAGNIGIGFNIASPTLPAGIRYTGRFNGDPLGEMTVAETTIIDGVGVQSNTNRFGDYSHLTMDPDNFTFWHTAEYFASNNFWTTRVASFSLSGGFANDVGVNNITAPESGILTNAETVEVVIRNFGADAQSNIPLELRVNGTLEASETFTGTINPNETGTYSFSQTVDLSNEGDTYTIEAKTVLSGDEFTDNDGFTKDATHYLGDDVGITAVPAPESGEGLGIETVTVTITNFGDNPQSNFDVQYSLDGDTPVVETFTGTIDSQEEVDFSFSETADLSILGTYEIDAQTNLSSDQNTDNDAFQVTVENLQCLPTADCSDGDGIEYFVIGTIDNTTSCSPNGYGDYTDLNTELDIDSTVEVTIASGFISQIFSLWIDYNDNSVFDSDELLIEDVAIPNAGEEVTVSIAIPDDQALLGTHLLRVRAGYSETEDTTADPCIDFTWGETEDYTVTITDPNLAVGQQEFNNTDVLIYRVSNKIYEVSFNTTTDFGTINYEVFNTLGQKITAGNMDNSNDGYKTTVNLASVASGMYLVKLYNNEFSTVKRLIVQ